STVASLNVSGNKYVGSTLKMEATANPQTDTLYKLWVCDRSTDTWTVLSDWSSKNSIDYVPKKAGRYTFTVHVKHKNSSNVNEDDYKSMDVNVASPKSTVASLNVSGNKYVGSTLKMEATA
ncbi:hypothetical protein GNF51_16925, partial [Clostridium perfringens]|uniref:triple tyrosine motif-containing protein n=1 Tax=Clostridium perfringens TaxID=1502 RepID=UPI002AC6F919